MLQNRIYRGEIVHKGKSYPGEHEAIVDETLWNNVQAILAQNRVDRANERRRAAYELRYMCTEGAATSHVRIASHSRRQLLANAAIVASRVAACAQHVASCQIL